MKKPIQPVKTVKEKTPGEDESNKSETDSWDSRPKKNNGELGKWFKNLW